MNSSSCLGSANVSGMKSKGSLTIIIIIIMINIIITAIVTVIVIYRV